MPDERSPDWLRNGLLGALAHFGLDAMDALEKDELRELAIRGGPFTETERLALLDYCEADVRATTRLLNAMVERIDLPRALLRGRYMTAVARMEATGTPLDVETLTDLRTHWTTIKSRLTRTVNRDFGVYVPADARPLDRGTDWGRAVFETADVEQLDPDRLAAVADDLWRVERENARELRDALDEARRATGLSVAKLNRWEDAGHDSSTWRDSTRPPAHWPGSSRCSASEREWIPRRGAIRPTTRGGCGNCCATRPGRGRGSN